MTALAIVALVLGILAAVALLLAVILVPVARRARRLRSGLEKELGGTARRIANARGLGLESRGARQVRGNGWLVLTADELRFRQWVPNRETRIPLEEVIAVETPRWWLGKAVGSRLLCVRWRGSGGIEDAMAWEVPDLDAWLAALSAQGGPAELSEA